MNYLLILLMLRERYKSTIDFWFLHALVPESAALRAFPQ
jgi:hypothetical protein